jgi:hypothetical protein
MKITFKTKAHEKEVKKVFTADKGINTTTLTH